jgi:hypothetical protein
MGYMIRLVTQEHLLEVVLVVYRVENITMDHGMWVDSGHDGLHELGEHHGLHDQAGDRGTVAGGGTSSLQGGEHRHGRWDVGKHHVQAVDRETVAVGVHPRVEGQSRRRHDPGGGHIREQAVHQKDGNHYRHRDLVVKLGMFEVNKSGMLRYKRGHVDFDIVVDKSFWHEEYVTGSTIMIGEIFVKISQEVSHADMKSVMQFRGQTCRHEVSQEVSHAEVCHEGAAQVPGGEHNQDPEHSSSGDGEHQQVL